MAHRSHNSKPRGRQHQQLESARTGERLQKILAGSGYGSRRQCEGLILEGRVEVDGKVVVELGTRADPSIQEIRLDGEAIPRLKLIYYLVNKPPGTVSTNRDPAGRSRVIDLVPGGDQLFTVGRLDRSSEGLVLVTNDGDLTYRLSHPRFGIEKTYVAEVHGQLTDQKLKQLRKGIHLSEAFAQVVGARVKRSSKNSTTLEIVLNEGRNREIRRMLARVGHKVVGLKRVALGPLKLGQLPIGAYRQLTRDEVRALRRVSSTTPQAQPSQKKSSSKQRRTGKRSRNAT